MLVATNFLNSLCSFSELLIVRLDKRLICDSRSRLKHREKAYKFFSEKYIFLWVAAWAPDDIRIAQIASDSKAKDVEACGIKIEWVRSI